MTVSALMIAALLALGARAQSQEAPAPDPPAAATARALVGSINSGSEASLRQFLESHLPESVRAEVPIDPTAHNLHRLYEQSGGFRIDKLTPGATPGGVRMQLSALRSGRWLLMGVRTDPDHPERITGFGTFTVPREDPWPTKRMDKDGVAKEIRKHAADSAKRDEFSGVVLVAKGDRVLVREAYGEGEREFQSPIRVDTKFNLGSMNKMFTSIAVAQLVQQGKLSYDDHLGKILPDFPNEEAAEKVTIRQMLTHTAGLGDIFVPEYFNNRDRYRNPRDYFPLFANRKLDFEPGSDYRYSNAGFVVLGAIIERLSGQSYYDYVRDHVFKPAEMRDTDSFGADEITPNRATGYTHFLNEDDPLGTDPPRSNIRDLPWRGSPAGGGYSTARDLLRFAQALRGHRLLKAEFADAVTKAQRKTPQGDYGYGFELSTVNGKEIYGHSGGAPGINSALRMFRDGSYAVIVLGNYDPPAAQNLAEQIVTFLARQ